MKNTDVIGLAINYLNKKYKTQIGTSYYDEYVKTWREWWEGYVEAVHSYRELGVDQAPRKRHLYRLKMAKRVCEDWAALLLNEKTTLTVEHAGSSEFLQGKDGTGGVLEFNNFWSESNELLEKAFALGTAAFVVRAEGAKIDANGNVTPDANCKVGIEYVDAMHIIPLSVKKSKITECAFVSTYTKRGKDCCYIETHTQDKSGNYVITNECFTIEGAQLKTDSLPDGMAETVNTNSPIPWFTLIYPNIANNIRDNNGLGMAVYADATDSLLAVDIAFNNFVKDFKLGGKKVFYNKDMLKTNAEEKTITPDDVAQQLFQQIGDGIDFDAKTMVQEYNPALRVAENKDGVQSSLDYLSFKCGMGTHRYKFENSGIKTATEYSGERQELVQHASKHMIVIEAALKALCKAVLYIGKVFCGANTEPETLITVNFEDGFIIDEQTQREQYRQDVREGLRAPWEYRAKFCGETEEQAKAAISNMQVATNNPFGFMG
jgi:A118 family predicted phage portal protein